MESSENPCKRKLKMFDPNYIPPPPGGFCSNKMLPKEKQKEFWFDLDGTLCTEEHSGRRSLARPMTTRVEHVRGLKERGHFIGVFTARTWGEYDMTKQWLSDNDVPHDILVCGKPQYTVFIDDRAQTPEDFFGETNE